VAETAPTLHFDESTHTYSVDGQKWPSVTAILDPLLELDGIPRAALEAAAQFGSHVHMATDLYDKGQLDEEALDPHLAPYLAGWKAFLRESGAVVLASELRVSHRLLKVAGTLDKLVRWQKHKQLVPARRYILDVKSGADVPWTVGMQTSGYRELYLDQFGLVSEEGEPLATTRLCVHLKPEGKYKLHVLDDSRDRNDFISAVNFHNLRKRRGR
jgi:hypothetical protein